MLCHRSAAALKYPLQGTGPGKDDMEDKLLPTQRVPPLHITSKGKVGAHTTWHQCCHWSCQNDVEVKALGIPAADVSLGFTPEAFPEIRYGQKVKVRMMLKLKP